MELQEEIQLVEESKTNVQAFDKLYDYYFPKVYAYCLNRLANKELAQDVTSIVFIKAIEYLKTFNTREKIRFGAWLYRVAHNVIIDQFRKEKKKYRLDPEIEVEAMDNDDPLKELQNLYLKKQIAAVLSELNPRYQEIISLKFYSELDNSEIAEIMKISSSQTSVVLHRALSAFKDKFKKRFSSSEIF